MSSTLAECTGLLAVVDRASGRTRMFQIEQGTPLDVSLEALDAAGFDPDVRRVLEQGTKLAKARALVRRANGGTLGWKHSGNRLI